MTYRVTAIGPDWVEIWDGDTMTDPDWPGEKHTIPIHVGEPHHFMVDDFVDLALRLVARITPPEQVAAARKAVEGTEYQWCSDEELLGKPS